MRIIYIYTPSFSRYQNQLKVQRYPDIAWSGFAKDMLYQHANFNDDVKILSSSCKIPGLVALIAKMVLDPTVNEIEVATPDLSEECADEILHKVSSMFDTTFFERFRNEKVVNKINNIRFCKEELE